MKSRIEFFGNNPVRYLTDDKGLDYVCVNDLRDACDTSTIKYVGSNSVN